MECWVSGAGCEMDVCLVNSPLPPGSPAGFHFHSEYIWDERHTWLEGTGRIYGQQTVFSTDVQSSDYQLPTKPLEIYIIGESCQQFIFRGLNFTHFLIEEESEGPQRE